MIKYCTNPECRSNEARRKRYCRQLCRNCYQRWWRGEQVLKVARLETKIDETQISLLNYKRRNLPSLRRHAVQRLLDTGKQEAQVIIAFGERDELLQLLAGLQDPLKALKRDIAFVVDADRCKPDHQRQLERQIRQTRELLEEAELSVREQARLHVHLHRLESDLLENL